MLMLAGFAEPFTFVATVVFVAPVEPLTDVVVVVWVVVFALLLFMAVVLVLLALEAVLLLAASPQAIPNAPKAKRVESAIIFFMSKWTLLSFSKIYLLIFTYYRPCGRHCSETFNFGTIDNIVIQSTLVNY